MLWIVNWGLEIGVYPQSSTSPVRVSAWPADIAKSCKMFLGFLVNLFGCGGFGSCRKKEPPVYPFPPPLPYDTAKWPKSPEIIIIKVQSPMPRMATPSPTLTLTPCPSPISSSSPSPSPSLQPCSSMPSTPTPTPPLIFHTILNPIDLYTLYWEDEGFDDPRLPELFI